MPYPPGLENSKRPALARALEDDIVLARKKDKKVENSGRKGDFFSDLKSLKLSLKEGKDFDIKVVDRGSPVTVVSPHGGFIEFGTSQLARSLAEHGYNLFDFRGISRAGARRGHVTSTRFRDPRLMVLLNKSRVCVSFHRMRDRHDIAYLGGNNKSLKRLAALYLRRSGFNCDTDPPRLKGKSTLNFVNLAEEEGLQVEIPVSLARQLMPGLDKERKACLSRSQTEASFRLPRFQSPRFESFIQAIFSAVEHYLSGASAEQN